MKNFNSTTKFLKYLILKNSMNILQYKYLKINSTITII